MHILFLHQYFCPPGGTGNNRSFELLKHWVKAGARVTMLTSDAFFPEEQKLRHAVAEVRIISGAEVHILPVAYSHHMRFRRRIRSFLSFYRQAKQYTRHLDKPDMIYASSTPLTAGELGRKLHHQWQVPFVLETVDVWPDVPEGMGILRNRTLLKWLHRRTNRIYSEASRIVALSEGMKDQILKHGRFENKIIVSPNGTSPESFVPERRNTGTEIIALYAGTVGIANDTGQLIQAAALVQQKSPHVRIRILGNGNDLLRVKQLAAELRTRNVEFVNAVPKENMPEEFSRAGIGIVCFAPFQVLEANSANKFFDCLAAGLPVVINYRGWQAKVLEEYGCGLSSDQGDNETFAANILRLAADPEMRTRMGANARALAVTKYDRAFLAAQLLEEFRQI